MSTSTLNTEEIRTMEHLMEDNKMMRRKLTSDNGKYHGKNRRVPVRVYVKDANEIIDMRKRLQELEKMEALYKSRINELEGQVSNFNSFHSKDSASLPSDNTISPIREHSRKQAELSNVMSLASSDSDFSSGASISVKDTILPVQEPTYSKLSLEPRAMGSLRRSSNADRTKLLALYDFFPSADTTGRLSFKEGDILLLVSMKSRSGWWMAELNGQVGKIPSNYVEQLDPSRAFKARVIKNFDSQQPGDMSIQRGTLVTILKRQENGWYLGEKGSKTGFFPSTCVERISTPVC